MGYDELEKEFVEKKINEYKKYLGQMIYKAIQDAIANAGIFNTTSGKILNVINSATIEIQTQLNENKEILDFIKEMSIKELKRKIEMVKIE